MADAPLVEVAARDDARSLETTRVENAAYPATELDEIAAVESHPGRTQSRRHHRARCRDRVVGVEQQDRVLPEQRIVGTKCADLVG